ncbi:MAG: LamG domain-containing protein [Candidatus Woesearchaeota archaeon]
MSKFALPKKFFLAFLVITFSLIISTTAVANLSSSGNYSLASHSITAGGNASSDNYSSAAVIEGTTGGASSDSYTTQLGFQYESENNTPPYISSVSLASESGNDLESDDIILSYTTGDNQSDNIRVVTDFRLNGTSIAVLNMPFDLPVTDVNTYLQDYSTNAFHGVLGDGSQDSTPRWSEDCVAGGCFEFDGSDDYIQGDFSDGGDVFTVSAWVKTSSSKTTLGVAGYTDGSGNRREIYLSDGDSLRVFVPDGYYTSSSHPINDGDWHHIVGGFDGNSYFMYLDNESITGDFTSYDTTHTPDLFRIGHIMHSSISSDYVFDGSIDEVLIFDRSLSAAQIQEIYRAGLDNKSFETIKSDETDLNDDWTAKVTPVDGLDRGSSTLSNEVFIGTPEPELVYNNSFVNETDAHAFLVTAGAYYDAGGDQLTSSISESDACSLDSENVDGDYYNATYRCVGTPFTSETVSIDFCDSYSQCVSSASSSNTYPNRAPTMNSLVSPSNGDDAVHDLTPTFDWQPGSDAEDDTLNYTFNLTTIFGCQDVPVQNVTSSEFTPSNELCPDALEKYYWTVRACDAWNCSDWHPVWNFTIEPYVDITMTNDQIDFGTLDILETNSTDGTADAFTFRSDSNVNTDLVNVTADQSLWDSPTGDLGSEYMRIKARETTETGSFNTSGSLMSWFNLTTETQNVINDLNYSDSSDEAYIDLEVTVPGDEPPGTKESGLTFAWEQS